MVRRCWVNFQCRGVLLIWIRVGQGPIVLAVGAGGVVGTFFSLIYHFSFLSPSLWKTARYRLKYCVKGPLSPKQPTNQPSNRRFSIFTATVIVSALRFTPVCSSDCLSICPSVRLPIHPFVTLNRVCFQ